MAAPRTTGGGGGLTARQVPEARAPAQQGSLQPHVHAQVHCDAGSQVGEQGRRASCTSTADALTEGSPPQHPPSAAQRAPAPAGPHALSAPEQSAPHPGRSWRQAAPSSCLQQFRARQLVILPAHLSTLAPPTEVMPHTPTSGWTSSTFWSATADTTNGLQQQARPPLARSCTCQPAAARLRCRPSTGFT